MKRRVLSAAIATLFLILNLCSALPVSADADTIGTRYSTPPGYNGNDYQKLVTFLEQKDGSGVKNGKKLNSAYSPTNPSTWTGAEWMDSRLSGVRFPSKGVVGKLDLSGCAGLTYISCGSNPITELNVSGCTLLMDILCSSCSITKIDLTNCSTLQYLNCSNNSITQLNLSSCSDLVGLRCWGNLLRELIYEPYRIRAAGNGYVGYDYLYEYDEEWDEDVQNNYLTAEPKSGASFIGWYTESGTLVSTNAWFRAFSTSHRTLVARFSGWNTPVQGDADRNGIVDTTDALIVLRCALGISGSAQQLLSNCDMDGNRRIDTTDALMILRTALGIA